MTQKGTQIRVGITTGDTNGIGMETILKVFEDPRMSEELIPIVFGNDKLLKAHAKALGYERPPGFSIKDLDKPEHGKLNVYNVWEDQVELKLGQPTKEAGQKAYESLKAAVDALASNKIDVLVTCPINKDTIQNEAFNFPGHTEYLAKMSNVEESLMFLVTDHLRVGVVTGHMPLKDVAAQLSKAAILKKLRLMNESLIRDFGVPSPKIAVLGLNPHAGDNGLLGEEEKEIITPAVREANGEKIYAYGPFASDGFFGSDSMRKFDGVLAMYHDQGLSPFKTLSFGAGVNFTAGLPIVRTSPDHGTGYDIAGKNLANESSLRQAIFTGVDIYRHRQEFREFGMNPLEKQKAKDDRS